MGHIGPSGGVATWTKLANLAHAPPNPRVWGGGPREGAAASLGLRPKGPPSPYIKASLLPSSPLLSLALVPLVWSWHW